MTYVCLDECFCASEISNINYCGGMCQNQGLVPGELIVILGNRRELLVCNIKFFLATYDK